MDGLPRGREGRVGPHPGGAGAIRPASVLRRALWDHARRVRTGDTPTGAIGRFSPARARRRAATIAEWRAAHAASPQATFFHGPDWSEAWSAASGGLFRPAPVRIELAEGRWAVIGFTEESRRGGRRLRHLSPGGTYGGWVSEFPLSAADERLLADEVVGRGSLIWRQAPFASQVHLAPLRARPGFDQTHVIGLDGGAQVARGRWREKARGRVNKAAKAGVSVREATSTLDWMAYYMLYRATVTRWENVSSAYDWEMFAQLERLGAGAARLWLAELDGELMAGALTLVHHGYVSGWHQSSRRDGVAGVPNLLHWEITGRLADEGFAVYDLNPSGGHAGSAEFKERMGARAVASPLIVRAGAMDHHIQTVLHRLNRRSVPR
jgi:hypothetical protein